jgi:hypothetical protein
MTKLTNCSIIAFRRRRGGGGGDLRGSCTTRARPPPTSRRKPTLPALIPPRQQIRSTRLQLCNPLFKFPPSSPQIHATRSGPHEPSAARRSECTLWLPVRRPERSSPAKAPAAGLGIGGAGGTEAGEMGRDGDG